MPAAAQRPPQGSDEKLVVTTVAIFLVAALIVAFGGYKYLQHWQQDQEQSRAERQTYQRYNDYLKSTQDTAPKSPEKEAPAEAAASAQPSMSERLMNHSAVTPGPGFNSPGVQQTGVTIIDAMDLAQASAKPRNP
ncbi:hypothetical protein AB6724_18595 [Comamonas guangdongensis]|uniref:Uncharacterized protein n=2 Tax=Comamonas guangdongensis TaxID=510515 RepID=A0ABV3ZZ78_9BURK